MSAPKATSALRVRVSRRLTASCAAVVAIAMPAAAVWWPPPGELSIGSIAQCDYEGGKLYVAMTLAWSGTDRPKTPPTATLGGSIEPKATVVASSWTGSISPFASTVEITMPANPDEAPSDGFVHATMDQPYYTYDVQVPMSISAAHPCQTTGPQTYSRDWHPI